MLARPSKRIALILGAGGALFLAGCGGAPPPCTTDLTQVDAARSAAQSADAELQKARDQKARLEAQIADEQRRSTQLESRKADLEKRIAELEQ